MAKKTKLTSPDPQKAVAYARVSTVEQAERDLSLPAQIDAIRRYAASEGFELVEEYVERGASGTDDRRPEFQRMMDQVLAPDSAIGAIVVIHSSRFMRDVGKARFWKTRLGQRGVRVLAVQQPLVDDPSGRMVEGIFESFDQYESEMIGVRTSAGMRENARRGFFNGSAPPFGFQIEKVTVGSQTKNKLAVAPLEAEVLREVFREYVGGSGAKAVAQRLNERGLLYRNKPWTLDKVLKVLAEPAAKGTYYWGRNDSKRGILRPPEEWIAIPVPRIMDDDLFDRAQAIREQRNPMTHPGRAASSPTLLGELITCAKCGATYQLQTATSRLKKEYRYYNCRSALRVGRKVCTGHRIRVEVLDQLVLNHVATELFSEERCLAIVRDFVEEQGVLRQKRADQRRLLEKERDELRRKLEAWYARIESNEELAVLGADRIRQLKERLKELERALGEHGREPRVPPHLYSKANIRRVQARLKARLMAGGPTAKAYLRLLLERIVVNKETIVVYARAEAVVGTIAKDGSIPENQTTTPGVRTDVGSWRPREESNLRPTV